MEAGKFSLAFTKKIEKKTLQPSALRGEAAIKNVHQRETIETIEENVIITNKAVENELVIPLLERDRVSAIEALTREKNRHGRRDGQIQLDSHDRQGKETVTPSKEAVPEKELSLEEQAAQALLEEARRQAGEDESGASGGGGGGVITAPAAAASTTVGKLSTAEDYEEMEVENYGAALLRGMGWRKDEGVGSIKNRRVVSVIEAVSVTLSAQRKPRTAAAGAVGAGEEEEALPLVKGAFVLIHSGRHRGNYGEVQCVEEDHLLVRKALGGSGRGEAVVREVEANVEVVTQKQYRDSARVINKQMYDTYKVAETAEKKGIKREKKDYNSESEEEKKSIKKEKKELQSYHRRKDYKSKYDGERVVEKDIKDEQQQLHLSEPSEVKIEKDCMPHVACTGDSRDNEQHNDYDNKKRLEEETDGTTKECNQGSSERRNNNNEHSDASKRNSSLKNKECTLSIVEDNGSNRNDYRDFREKNNINNMLGSNKDNYLEKGDIRNDKRTENVRKSKDMPYSKMKSKYDGDSLNERSKDTYTLSSESERASLTAAMTSRKEANGASLSHSNVRHKDDRYATSKKENRDHCDTAGTHRGNDRYKSKAVKDTEEKSYATTADTLFRMTEEKSHSETENKSRRGNEDKRHRRIEDKSHREIENKSHRGNEDKRHRRTEDRSHRRTEDKSQEDIENKSHRGTEDKSHRGTEDKFHRGTEDKSQREIESKSRRENEDKRHRGTDNNFNRSTEDKKKSLSESLAARYGDCSVGGGSGGTAPWVQEGLTVRLISKQFKSGKHYKEKVFVECVVTAAEVHCRTAEGALLRGVQPEWLETVIPKQPPRTVILLRGAYKGQVGVVLEQHKQEEVVSVQLLDDVSMVLRLHYDDVCQYKHV